MKIKVNGKEEILEKQLSIKGYLQAKGLKAERVVVEYNGQILAKDKWDNIILKENDSLEVLKFVGGG